MIPVELVVALLSEEMRCLKTSACLECLIDDPRIIIEIPASTMPPKTISGILIYL